MPTLGPDNRNRKLWFDAEMVPHCGKRAPVNRNVQRIIDETTGKMIKLTDCVVLDNVFCQASITDSVRVRLISIGDLPGYAHSTAIAATS